MTVGILALQGAVEPHVAKFSEVGATTRLVRRAEDFEELSGLVVPGGESSTFLHLIERNQLWDSLKDFCQNRPVWGVCAGAILLSAEVTSPAQRSLALIDTKAIRNAYGRQNESFISPVEATEHWKGPEVREGVFIRAPKLQLLSKKVLPLLECRGDVVMAEQEQVLVSSFHPELSEGTSVHAYFLEKCGG